MDVLPPLSSIPQASMHSTTDGDGMYRFTRLDMRLWMHGMQIILFGFGTGIIFAMAVLFLPYNRIVLFAQPESPALKVASAHLTRGGFVVLYLRTKDGLALFGNSGYLPSGYYRNIVVPVDFFAVYEELGREVIVRLYRDTGDKHFSPQDDEPVNDVFGQLYQKRMWFRYPQKSFRQIWLSFLDHPASFVFDAIIP